MTSRIWSQHGGGQVIRGVHTTDVIHSVDIGKTNKPWRGWRPWIYPYLGGVGGLTLPYRGLLQRHLLTASTCVATTSEITSYNSMESSTMESTRGIYRGMSLSAPNIRSGCGRIILICVWLLTSCGVSAAKDQAISSGEVTTPKTIVSQPKGTSWQPVVTPWWNLTFGEGEQLEVDCGVPTGTDPTRTTITWLGPEGTPLKALHDDRYVSQIWITIKTDGCHDGYAWPKDNSRYDNRLF